MSRPVVELRTPERTAPGLTLRWLGGEHYQVVVPIRLRSRYGWIQVPAGFRTDGDSLGRWKLALYAWLKGRTKLGAVAHDWAYASGQIAGRPITRKQADVVFLDVMRDVEKVAWRHRTVIYCGVRIGGWIPWGQHRRRDPHPLLPS